jgi:stearoyl-CoA desaturase (delta-9 desaturase)
MGILFDKRYFILLMQLIGPPISLWALFTYSTPVLVVTALVMFFLMKCIGVTITYHRIHAHRTHMLTPITEFVCTALGFYGSSISPIEFCGSHNNHHKYVDTDKDPHPHSIMGWKSLFPVFWNNSAPTSGDLRTMVRLRRNKTTNLFHTHYYKLILLPFVLLFVSTPVYFFVYFIPMTMTMWAGSYATFNHDETGPINRGWLFGIVTGGEHYHVWHHSHPNDTSGEGWLNSVANLIGKKRTI